MAIKQYTNYCYDLYLIFCFVFNLYCTCIYVNQSHILPGDSEVYAVIWTTTPWSVPANQAVSYSPDIRYVVVKGNQFIKNHFYSDVFSMLNGDN